jgi:hypothetical protein
MRPSFTANDQTDQLKRLLQAQRAATMTLGDTRQWFSKNDTRAGRIIAEEAASPQSEADRRSMPRDIA